MLLSQKLISILKNFSAVNPNLYLEEFTNEVVTVKKSNVVLCRAVVDEKFPVNFGIYKLTDFLGAVSLFDEPFIAFDELFCTIHEAKDKRKRLKYFYADKTTLLLPPANNVPIPEKDIVASFTLTEDSIKNITRAAAMLQLDSIAIGIDDDRASIGAEQKTTGNEASNNYSLDISDIVERGPAFSSASGVFNLYIDKLNVNPISGCDYKVDVTNRAVRFDSTDSSEYNVTYWYAPRLKRK